jgi:hypothetical protein
MQRSNSPGLLKIWGANAAKAASHHLSSIAHYGNFICVLFCLVLTFPFSSRALTNGLALTPVGGENAIVLGNRCFFGIVGQDWVAETPPWLKCDTWFELDGVPPQKISPQQKTCWSDSNPKCLPSRAVG